MATERANGSPIFVLFLLTVVAVIASTVIFPIAFTNHALTSHPESISDIDSCFTGGGTLSPIFKLDNNRWGQYCNDGGRNNFWRIFECRSGDTLVVTQFKQAVRRLNNYIKNHGMVVEEYKC